MSTTTITQNDQPEIFDHEIDEASFASSAPRTSFDEHDRMLDYIIAESREQKARERRREAQRIQTHRRRTRAAVATGTVAIVIAVGGTLFFVEGPSHGTTPASSGSAPAAAIQPSSGGSQTSPSTPTTPAIAPVSPTTTVPASNVTPATPAPGPSGNNTGNMGTGANTQIPSGNNTGNMGSNGGPLNVPVSQ